MAKQSFLSRFPHAGLIMVIAVVLAIPLTVWSFNNAPTQTQQHAQSVNCSATGGSCVSSGRDCLSGYTNANYSCSSGVCCVPAATAPAQNLSSSSSSCVNYNITFTAKLNLSWSKVKDATSYRVTVYDQVATNVFSPTSNSFSTSRSFANGYRVYWYVEAYNKFSNHYGPKSAIKEIVFSCNKPLVK